MNPVHKLVPESVWSKRYELINECERMLVQNGTSILRFYLRINPEEQLARFKEQLDDPARHWKISGTDYSERELWPHYVAAFEEAMEQTSIPANHKWLPRSGHLADRHGHAGGDGAQAAAHAGGHLGDPAQIPCSRAGGARGKWG